jgi:antitoxin component of MazEF toxin-antitoxin module
MTTTTAPALVPPTAKPAPLKGEALLSYVDAHKDQPQNATILGAGYWKNTKDKEGNPRVSLRKSAFFAAIGEAHGTKVGPDKPEAEPAERTPNYLLKIGPKGLVPIGAAYTKQIGAEPGSYVKVIIEDGVIILDPDDAEAVAKTQADKEAEAKENAGNASASDPGSNPESTAPAKAAKPAKEATT